MYNVSNTFLQKIRQPVIEYDLDGVIGNVAFTKDNIISGSFHIQNQCTDTSDVVLGSVYTGTLTATFRDVNIPRYSWVGKRIHVVFSLKISASTFEDVPLGYYTIKEAKHTAQGVEVIAYDDMIKLDKKFKAGKFKTAQKMYQHLQTICTACGLTLGMTEEEIQALPNGNTNLGIVGTKSNKYLSYKKYSNDIDTYRDLVFWIAQSMGTFATINRDGELVFRKYKKTTQTVDEITESYRLAGAVFDDFTTNYTGIYVTNTKDGEEIYYGYDVDELITAIADTEAAIAENEGERMELWTQYQEGEITEEEYKAAVKPLEKRWKNLEKQLQWLNEALEKAENEEDGLFMDLGENPILQPDGIGSTYAAMRKRVLKALDAISYTPFTCSTVVGVHYDLGDVIQFTGGHATEIGETCCMMAYDFNLNGEFQMQGFGSDPSKPVIKNKNSKKADKADKNGVSAPNVSTGANLPETGNDGDLFIQTGGNISDEPLQTEYMTSTSTTSHPISVNNFSGDNDTGFSFSIRGNPDSQGYGEYVYFELQGLEENAQYTIEFDAQFTESGGWPWSSYHDRVVCNAMDIALSPDYDEHHYSGTFTYTENRKIEFGFPRVNDNRWFTCVFSNLKFAPASTDVNSVSYYSETNNQWNNIDFVKKIVDVLSGGKKIGTAKNSDGTDTDIYVPNMSGASASAAGSNGLVPAPASGDQGKFLRGDGTWQNVTGNYIPTSEKGAAGGVAELDNNGKVPSSQLPSYVDDVLEYPTLSDFPATGETGKIYIATDTNKSYRWSGSTYVEISSSLALGETSSTAYRGDRGKVAYDHATDANKISSAVASGLYKIAATAEGHVAGLTQVQKSDLTALGVAENKAVTVDTPGTYNSNTGKIDTVNVIQTDVENASGCIGSVTESLMIAINDHATKINAKASNTDVKGAYGNKHFDATTHTFDITTIETDKTAVYMAGDINTKLGIAIDDHAAAMIKPSYPLSVYDDTTHKMETSPVSIGYATPIYMIDNIQTALEDAVDDHADLIAAKPDDLVDLGDVAVSSPSDGQVLKYNSTSQKWENGAGGGGGASALDDLSDVSLGTLLNADNLVYNSTSGEWENTQIRVELTEAQFNQLSQAEKDDPRITYYVTDKPSLGYPVQDDGTATDLTDGALATGRTIENWASKKFLKAVRISASVKTGASATYRIGNAQVAVGSANFNTFDNYPTGKQILAYIPMLAVDSSSVQRGHLEIQTGNTGMFVFGSANTTYGCHFMCLYTDL